MNEETIRALQLCRVCQRVSEGKQLRRRRRRLTMFETMSVPSISTSVCVCLPFAVRVCLASEHSVL